MCGLGGPNMGFPALNLLGLAGPIKLAASKIALYPARAWHMPHALKNPKVPIFVFTTVLCQHTVCVGTVLWGSLVLISAPILLSRAAWLTLGGSSSP